MSLEVSSLSVESGVSEETNVSAERRVIVIDAAESRKCNKEAFHRFREFIEVCQSI
jgi:hypothetical protein